MDAANGTDAGPDFDGGPDFDAGPGMDAGPGSDAGPEVDAGADAGPSGVALDDFCDMFAPIVCEGVASCCSRAPGSWDRTTCIANYQDVCGEMTQRVRDYAFLDWDPVAATAALAQGQAYIDACDPMIQSWLLDLEDGYLAPIDGNRARGAVCTPSSTTNTYELLASALSCQPGLRCIKGAGEVWNCLDPAALGQPCSSAFDCASTSARCERDLNPFRGTCGAPGEAIGSLCYAADECESLVCRPDPGTLPNRCQAATQDNIYCVEGLGLPDS